MCIGNKENQEALSWGRVNELFELVEGMLIRKIDVGRRVKAGERAGNIRADGYREVRVDGVCYKEHRLIWFLHHKRWPEHTVDHINGKRDDNRIENLRDVTNAENGRGFKKIKSGASSSFRGVGWHGGAKKWQAYIKVDGSQLHIGLFEREKEAARAYDRAAIASGFAPEALNFFELAYK